MSAARILICDDEPALRELMRIALVGDYEFEEAGSVADAIVTVGAASTRTSCSST